jgi:hypothetical protein
MSQSCIGNSVTVVSRLTVMSVRLLELQWIFNEQNDLQQIINPLNDREIKHIGSRFSSVSLHKYRSRPLPSAPISIYYSLRIPLRFAVAQSV